MIQVCLYMKIIKIMVDGTDHVKIRMLQRRL